MLVDYGLPSWMTYVLFGLATILLGALLGLVLVSIIDLIFPPVSQNSRKSFSQAKATDEDARDEIEDDAEIETTSTAVAANEDDDDEEGSSCLRIV